MYICDSKTGYIYHLELHQGGKGSTELNLSLSVFLKILPTLEKYLYLCIFDNFLTVPH